LARIPRRLQGIANRRPLRQPPPALHRKEHAVSRISASQTQSRPRQAQEEAILLTQLAEANGETYDPASDFPSTAAAGEFVYSAPEIKRLIARASRLSDAKILFATAA
jgi:hypothetical protein